MKIRINNITSKDIGKKLETTGRIIKVGNPKPLIKNAVFQCNACLREYGIQQDKLNVNKPTVCQDCGGKNFKLIPEKSTYIDYQELIIEDSQDFTDKYDRKRNPRNIKTFVYDKDVNQHIKDDMVDIMGFLRIDDKSNVYIEIEDIELSKLSRKRICS